MSNWLATVFILSTLTMMTHFQLSQGVRIFKSRKKVLSLLAGAAGETQQYFSSCEQSSNSESCVMAVDSSVSDEYSQCAHTDKERKPRWKGYLDNPAYVSSVHILNSDWRRLGMKDGLLEFTISGSGVVCHTHSSNASFLSKTFPCDLLTSYIEIKSSLDNAAIVLCDVQAQGATLTFPTVLEYPPKPIDFDDCDQSSVHGSNNCWFASDKNSQHQKANLGYCAMTQPFSYEWWSGTFEKPAIVQQVILYNRVDCCQNDLINFAVTISGQQCARYNEPTAFNAKSFTCNLFGGGVRVQLMTTGVRLTLCEVLVNGHSVALTPDLKREYKGCYKDKKEDPDLSDYKDPVSLTSMQLNKCDRICRRLGKPYFAIQEGMQCWCGSSYGKHGKVADKECVMPCEGKQLQYCGGVNRNIVFELL